MIGINVDHRHWQDMDSLARTVRDCGGSGVRTVLKPNDDERMGQWIEACEAHNLLFLSVTALESVHDFDSYSQAMEYYSNLYGEVIHYWQIGNEPDGPPESPSSWIMDRDELNDLLQAANDALPSNAYIIGPGLVSGQAKWADGIDLQLVDALAGHHYSKATNLTSWFAGYKSHAMPFWVTEYPFIEPTATIKKNGVHGFFFCLSDVMVNGNGLLESSPSERALFKKLAESQEDTNVPEFVLGFADYAANNPNVGEPLTEEYTLVQITEDKFVRAQQTTNGLMMYHSESNTVIFLPKG